MPADLENESARACKRCGAPISGGAPLGQCPQCLLNVALERAVEGATDEIYDAGSWKVRKFGDYELLELIARGGMGLVYRARQATLDRIVALKMISTGDLASRAAVERFRTEAEAAARLEHSNIVPIYEIGMHEDQHYFTMRFLEGGTLTEHLSKKRFSPEAAADLMITVARAVHYAHRFGILHRDIKPGIILFDANSEPFVADFSLAKLLGTESGLTRSSAALGTPSYMAPEQITGEKHLSTAADVYGLGAVLYELLTGEPPFTAATPLETMRLALENEPSRPRTRNAAINRDLETICLKCLDKDPSRRYGSAEELADDLDAWQTHRPLKARPVSTTERVIKWGRRKPAIAGLIVALHLIALAGLLGIVWQARRANKHARIATAEANRANAEAANALAQTKRAENELWNAQLSEARAVRIAGGGGARVRGRALIETLVLRPGLDESQRVMLRQEAIAQLALTDFALPTNAVFKRSWQPLGWNRNLDRYVKAGESNSLNLHHYPSHKVLASFAPRSAANLDHAVISPDEQFVAATYSDGLIEVWRIQDGETVVQNATRECLYPRGASFSEDGRALLIASGADLLVQSLSPLLPARQLKQGVPITMARFSPDSKTIAAIVQSHATEIIDANSGEVLCHYHTEFPPERLAWHPDGSKLAIGGDRGRLEIHVVEPAADGKKSLRRVASLVDHQAFIAFLRFSPDGDFLFSVGWDYSAIVWDVRSARPLVRYPNVTVSAVHPAGDKVVLLREAEVSESVGEFRQPTGFRTLYSDRRQREPLVIWTSPDDQMAVVGYEKTESGQEGECAIWRLSDGMLLGSVPGIWAQFTPDSSSVLAFEREGNKLYRYQVDSSSGVLTNNRVLLYEGAQGERVNTGELMHDGRTLVIAATHAVAFLNINGDRPTRKWNVAAHVVEVSSDDQYIATMFQNDPCRLWRVENQQEVYTGPLYSHITFSPDKLHFCVATQHDIQVRSLRDQKVLFPPIRITGTATRPDVRFSHDGKFFAVLLERRFVRLYETTTGRHLADLTPPSSSPNLLRLRFTSDSSWLAVTGNHGETIGWRLPEIRRGLRILGLDWELNAPASSL
jgi:WD40 repeat protein/tRNA A-37 threonylcarbamoyl transferase component Bud32